MKKLPLVLNILIAFVIALSAAAAVSGLAFSGGQAFDFTTIHGETVEIYGQGLYRNDTLFKAPIFRGTDLVTLVIALPLLIVGLALANRGSLRGRVFLAGMLSYFMYVSVSLCFGAAYNPLFLVYVVLFSTSTFVFITLLSSFDLPSFPSRFTNRLPRRFIAGFLFVAGLSVFVWLIEIVGGLASGSVPAGLDHYTTDITAVIDIGIIPPTAYLAGILLLKGRPLGYLLAPVLMILNALVGVMVMSQTVFQNAAGIVLSTGQIVAYVGIFVTTSLFALGLTIAYFRSMTAAPQA